MGEKKYTLEDTIPYFDMDAARYFYDLAMAMREAFCKKENWQPGKYRPLSAWNYSYCDNYLFAYYMTAEELDEETALMFLRVQDQLDHLAVLRDSLNDRLLANREFEDRLASEIEEEQRLFVRAAQCIGGSHHLYRYREQLRKEGLYPFNGWNVP